MGVVYRASTTCQHTTQPLSVAGRPWCPGQAGTIIPQNAEKAARALMLHTTVLVAQCMQHTQDATPGTRCTIRQTHTEHMHTEHMQAGTLAQTSLDCSVHAARGVLQRLCCRAAPDQHAPPQTPTRAPSGARAATIPNTNVSSPCITDTTLAMSLPAMRLPPEQDEALKAGSWQAACCCCWWTWRWQKNTRRHCAGDGSRPRQTLGTDFNSQHSHI